MSATEVLKVEHQSFLRLVSVMNEIRHRIETRGDVPRETLRDVLTVLEGFVAKCHDAKEETALFKALAKRELPFDVRLLQGLEIEHRSLAKVAGLIREALARFNHGDDAATTYITKYLKAYVEILTDHISREEGIVFPAADNVLTQTEQEEMLRAFEEVENRTSGSREWRVLLQRLTKQAKQ